VPAQVWWLIAAAVALIIEMLSLDFIFLPLSIAALAAAIAAFVGAPVLLQFVVFVLVAMVLLFAVRPIALRHLRNTPQAVTNIDRMVGHRALVTDPVDHLGGRVKIGGEDWSARIDDVNAAPLTVGSYVYVTRIDGATAIVTTEQPASAAEEG
jgi:membrane protein implicated in regulation of membrane protease activity